MHNCTFMSRSGIFFNLCRLHWGKNCQNCTHSTDEKKEKKTCSRIGKRNKTQNTDNEMEVKSIVNDLFPARWIVIGWLTPHVPKGIKANRNVLCVIGLFVYIIHLPSRRPTDDNAFHADVILHGYRVSRPRIWNRIQLGMRGMTDSLSHHKHSVIGELCSHFVSFFFWNIFLHFLNGSEFCDRNAIEILNTIIDKRAMHRSNRHCPLYIFFFSLFFWCDHRRSIIIKMCNFILDRVVQSSEI